MSKRKRDTNLDLLRIISMLLIIFLHTIDHSGVLEQAEVGSAGMYFYVRFTYALCQVCVNCYVMLSGYYLVKARFRLQKLAVLWMEMVFYSFVLKLLFMVTGYEEMSIVSLVSCFFPILTGRYWFMTIYVGLYLVFPFLNKLVYAMNRKEHAILNLFLFVLFSLWNSIHPAIVGMNSGGGWGLTWFVVLYLAAAWLRLYWKPEQKPIVTLGCFFFLPLMMTFGQLAANAADVGVLKSVIANWSRYDSAPVYLMTMALFITFMNVRIKEGCASRMISAIAPLTLGVYLIHNHANVSPWLWKMMNLPAKMNGIQFFGIQCGCVVAIFSVCIVIDTIRRGTIGRLEDSEALCRACSVASNRAVKICDRIFGEN